MTISDKGQVVIPAVIRRRLGLEPGSKLDFELEGVGLDQVNTEEADRIAVALPEQIGWLSQPVWSTR
ncbi:AbrB/MazE/SpoVT family DNA-binding domain-containing protein [Halochromatium salexigens]|uniref:SpoVT-AbrB domain-containing protein n=1 Tax=Halochromatium salexigens TaxID=49447 RepID=A0AAJ0UHZ5_HALSE|nr:hypothetical protein [Halochromatium salexigens]